MQSDDDTNDIDGVDAEVISAAEMYDISDVKYSLGQTKSRKEIWLRMSSSDQFNLMRFYLALKYYIDSMEVEMGVLEGPGPDNPM